VGPVYIPLCQNMHNNEHCLLSFGCHVAVGDMEPAFHVRYISGEGEVSLLCSCPVLIVSLSCRWLSSHVIDPLSSCVSARCVRMNVGWGVLTRTTQPRQTMNLCCCSLFGCHIADSDMAPGFCIEEMIGRGR